MAVNILYILNATVKSGGATKSFMTLLSGVMKAGINATVVVPDREGIYEDLQHLGVKTYVITYRHHTYTDTAYLSDKILFLPRQAARLYYNHRASCQIVEICKECHINLIHTNVSVINIGFKAARELNIPHIVHFREYGDKDFGLTYFPSNRTFHDKIKKEKTYSICITRDIQQHHGMDDNSFSRVIYNGIEKRVEELPRLQDRTYFLYAGRLQETKGVMDLLEAFAMYARQQEHPLLLKIAGEPNDSAFLRKMKVFIKDHSLEDLVFLLGDCRNVRELYQNAWATIIPSRFEGFGRVMPEAMFSGCLCVGKNVAGTKEQLDNGYALRGKDIALRYDTIPELAKTMLYVHNIDAAEYEEFRKGALEVVNALYSTESYIDNVMDFYNCILTAKNEK